MKYTHLYSVLVCILLSSILVACTLPSEIPFPSLEPVTETEESETLPESTPIPAPSQTPAPSPEPETGTPKSLPEPTPVLVPEPEPCCPCGTRPDELIQYRAKQTAQWDSVPTIIVAARPNDPRIRLTEDAVEFWNQQLAEIGTPFRLGSTVERIKAINTDYLAAMSAAHGHPPQPSTLEIIADIPANIIIALSDGIFISFTSRISDDKKLIGIRDCSGPTLSLRNVQRNLIAHELGHAIGLGHNNDPTKLMCGRPDDGSASTCSPGDYHCEVEKFFPLTRWDKAHILRLYPPSWTP